MPRSTAPTAAQHQDASADADAPTARPVAAPRTWAPGRNRLWSALSVIVSTIGVAPTGLCAADASTDALRHRMAVDAPLNTTLSYLRAGNPTAPRLILVHGTPGSASGWSEYLANPPPGADVVALDRPGFGDSGPEGAVTSLEAQAAAVYALFPTDGRRVVLLGHSLGGPIVARVAAEHPDQVAAVVLLAASLDPALEQINPMQWVGTWTAVRWALPRAIRNANAELIALKPELQSLARLLPKITAPVLIVHGTKDDQVPLANVQFMQAGLTGARCVKTELLEGKNHFLPWNSTGVVRQAIAWALGAPC
ncbi:MAG: alpha/beta hydrolase [Burkholderiaceae bacterium]|nr:alpha/beta hydrolase [Burkholderiaceae bacterium]